MKLTERLQPKYLGIFFLAVCLTGCTLPPPGTYSLIVGYLPGLVKGKKPDFPPTRVLVLPPADGRQNLKVRDGTLPMAGDAGEIVGLHGLNSKQGTVSIAARDMMPDLGMLRVMDSGMRYPPDVPRTVYALPGLSEAVQEAIATHFCKAGFYVETVPSSLSMPLARKGQHADYALSCTIEEFSLLSLVRYQQLYIPMAISSHFIDVPIRGPTQAAVSLSLSLYRWPSGEIVWQGKMEDLVDDPTLGDSIHLYSSAEQTLTVALSRTVGSILITQSLQDILLRPWLHNRPTLMTSPWCDQCFQERLQPQGPRTVIADERGMTPYLGFGQNSL